MRKFSYSFLNNGLLSANLVNLTSSISALKTMAGALNHSEAEITGYRDVLNEIHLGYEHIDFRERDILRLHDMMMTFAGYEYGGQYKTDDNVILEMDADGNRRVCFRPTPFRDGNGRLSRLLSLLLLYKNGFDAGKYGTRTRIAISRLSKISCLRFIYAIRNWISAFQN